MLRTLFIEFLEQSQWLKITQKESFLQNCDRSQKSRMELEILHVPFYTFYGVKIQILKNETIMIFFRAM